LKSAELIGKTILCLSGSFTGIEENPIPKYICQTGPPELSFLVSHSMRCKMVSISAVQSSFLYESQIGKYSRQEW